jgi:hypothetical protein
MIKHKKKFHYFSLKFFIYLVTFVVLFISILSLSNSYYNQNKSLALEIRNVVMGPLSGEYGYETKIILREDGKQINVNEVAKGKPNIVVTMQYLDKYYPNIKKIGLVVGWYVDTLNAESVRIVPKVDSKINAEWRVGDYDRETAILMNKNSGGHPNWTGTATDRSVVELAKLLHERGVEVAIYPFLFVDTVDKPWRGHINAKSQEGIDNFFIEYEKFLLHYANLQYQDTRLKDVIHGFLLGSELEELLKYKSNKNEFPAVAKMTNLAGKVRKALGDKIKISYAANWSEYHHTDGGWYHLDELWSDHNIDYVGIDAYFPLTSHISSEKKSYDPMEIKEGWVKGEHYDYYIDGSGNKKALTPSYALENIQYWWQSEHNNPNGDKTKWQTKMKPIVFTEIGFMPIHKTTDAPYKYIEQNKDNLGLPSESDGTINAKFQYEAIKGTLEFLEDLKKDPNTREMVQDVYWYNVDPRPDNYDWVYNHEIKVREYEEGDKDLDPIQNKKIKDIIQNAPAKLK